MRTSGWRPSWPAPPALAASTLLVPGYVDAEEVGTLARFIAQVNPDIPYSLLTFSPQFYLRHLPVTSQAHTEEALAAAKTAGLTRARIGNIHLLGDPYDRPGRMTAWMARRQRSPPRTFTR